jgi:hypothetical protein
MFPIVRSSIGANMAHVIRYEGQKICKELTFRIVARLDFESKKKILSNERAGNFGDMQLQCLEIKYFVNYFTRGR